MQINEGGHNYLFFFCFKIDYRRASFFCVVFFDMETLTSNGCPAYQLLGVILQYFFSAQTKFLAYIFDVCLSVQDKGIVFFTNFYYIWNAPIILAVLITTKTLTNIEKKLSDSFNSLVRTSQHLNKGKTSIATFSKLWFWQQFIKRQIHYRLHIHVRNGCWLLVF